MPIKAVLFDMFDTLMMIKRNHDFYSPSLVRMYKYLNSNGIDVSFPTFEQAYTISRDEIYSKVEDNFEEPHFNLRVFKTLKKLGYNYDATSPLVTQATAEFCNEFITFVTPDTEAKALLQNLHGKYKLAIVSNFAIPECVIKLLQLYGLYEFFDAVLVSGAINKRKPSPEIFALALQALEVLASESVMVGDTINADIEGAKAVGAKSIYIKRREEAQIQGIEPDQTIKRLSELPLAIQRL